MTKLRAEIIRLRKDPAYTRVLRLLGALWLSLVLAAAAPETCLGNAQGTIAAFAMAAISLLLGYAVLGAVFGDAEQGADPADVAGQGKESPPEDRP